MTVRIFIGDVRERLAELPDESVDCCITSPPYYGLRDYGVVGQIGLEETPDAYIAELVAVFREVRRVLKPTGTLWLNLGDTYGGSGKGGNPEEGKQATNKGSQTIGTLYGKTGETARQAAVTNVSRRLNATAGIASKQLLMIPARVALALQADGWWLRSEIIWAKLNPMPESVTDRPTSSHEKIYLLAKSERYYFDADAVAESASRPLWAEEAPTSPGNTNRNDGGCTQRKTDKQRGHSRRHAGFNDRWDAMTKAEHCSGTRNIRNVWTIATSPFPEAHFATFPPALIEPCIKAGCPEFTCSECGMALDKSIKDAIRSGTNGTALRSLQEGIQEAAVPQGSEQILQPTLYGSGAAQEASAREDNVSALRGDNSSVPRCPHCAANLTVSDAIVPGTVLDCFGGAGTTGLVADRLGRDCILIEINPKYAEMARRRIEGDAPLYARVQVEAGAQTA